MPGSNARGPSDYRYKPLSIFDLDDEPRNFRLLTILPGSGDELINCHIDTFDLPRGNDGVQICYEALSWTWGEHEGRSVISVVERGPGDERRLFSVRPNLYQALKNLRSSKHSRVLWVDYICIDQSSPYEKAQQVKILSHIYRRASKVCIWLGEHENGSEKAVDLIINSFNDFNNSEEIINGQSLIDEWKALAALMDRQWFRQRWVVPEITLAKRATIYCGDETMTWSQFEIAVSLFQSYAGHLESFYRAHQSDAPDHGIFGDVDQMNALKLVQLRRSLFHYKEEGEIDEWRFSLGELVPILWSYEAKFPHDTIYAILSLARDTQSRVNMSPLVDQSPFAEHDSSDACSEPATGSTITEADIKTAGVSSTRPAEDARSSKRKRSLSSCVGVDEKLEVSDGPASSRKTRVGNVQMQSTQSEPITGPRVYAMPEQRSDAGALDSGLLTDELSDRPTVPKTGASKPQRAVKAKVRTIFDVNYEQPFLAVCRHFLEFAIPKTASYNLDILLRPWAPQIPARDGNTAIRLPSWIPSVNKAAFERTSAPHAPGGFKITRVNADPLVGQSIHGSRSSCYNACGTSQAYSDEWRPGEGGDCDDRLYVKGFVLDIIDVIKDASLYGSISSGWLKLGGWSKTQPNSDHVVDAIWLTLVADRGPDGGPAKVYWRKAFEQAVKDSSGGGINTVDLKHHGHPIVVEFLKRVEAVVTNRRMFKGRFNHKNLGLAPEEAEKGDYVCIIHGMSVPVVLRPVHIENKTHYQMIGECYVHTMMDGRATAIQQEQLGRLRRMHDLDDEGFTLWNPRWFELR